MLTYKRRFSQTRQRDRHQQKRNANDKNGTPLRLPTSFYEVEGHAIYEKEPRYMRPRMGKEETMYIKKKL
jgi:hypothetical protein